MLTGGVALINPSHSLVAGIAVFLVAPHVLAWLQRRNVPRLQEAENLLTFAFVALLGRPLVPAVAIATVLLIGTVSQRGFAGLIPAAITLASGSAVGVLL